MKRDRPKGARTSRGARANTARRLKRKRTPHTGPSTGLTFVDLQELAQEFEGIDESTSYGTPALKVRGALLVRLREDGETIALRTTFVDRDLLLQADPEVYYVTDHYRNYPYVLVRLARIRLSELRDRLEEAYARTLKCPRK